MLKNKCMILPKCLPDLTDHGKVAFIHNNKDLNKLPFNKNYLKVNKKYSFIEGKLCCDNKGSYNKIPKDGIFYSSQCPVNSDDLGESGLYFDYNDTKLSDSFNFKKGFRNENSIWGLPRLCKAKKDLDLDDPNIYLHGKRCQGIWKDVAKSGFLIHDDNLSSNPFGTKPFLYYEPYNYSWMWTNPILCKIDAPTKKSSEGFKNILKENFSDKNEALESGRTGRFNLTNSLKKDFNSTIPIGDTVVEKLNYCTTRKKTKTGDPLDPTPDCDVFMLDFCSQKDNKDLDVCACINSKLTFVGSPICIDKRCLDKGYKTTGMTSFKCDQIMTPFKCTQYYDLKNKYPEKYTELIPNEITKECLKPPPPLDRNVYDKTYPIDAREYRDNFIFYLVLGFFLFILLAKKIYSK